MKKLMRQPFVWLIILSIVFFVSRLAHLTQLPIFTDEAIYIRWAQIGGRDASWRFISLTDGKQPLFTWLVMISLRIFHDPLFAGRIVSVFSGFLGMMGMYVLGTALFKNKKIGVAASLLYIISPFALFYDRLALYDSLVCSIFVWNCFLTVLLVRNIQLDVALLLGLGLGVGMLNKTSAFFSLYLLPFSLVLFDWKRKAGGKRLFTWIGLAAVAAILSQLIYSILRLSPYFYIIAQKNTIFVYPLSEWVAYPFRFFIGNIRGMFDWLIEYMTWPLFLSSFAGACIFWKNTREKALLVIWWFVPFAMLALFGRVLYPRFILFMAMPLLVLSAWTLNFLFYSIKNRWVGLMCIGLICFLSAFDSYTIIADIKTARIPYSERGQYVDDWPSGWGVREIVLYITNESMKGKVSVYTEGTFGLMPYAFEIYLGEDTNVDIHGIWPIPSEMPLEVVQKAADHPTYFVMYQNQKPPSSWPLQLLEEYQKGLNRNSTMRLYKVIIN